MKREEFKIQLVSGSCNNRVGGTERDGEISSWYMHILIVFSTGYSVAKQLYDMSLIAILRLSETKSYSLAKFKTRTVRSSNWIGHKHAFWIFSSSDLIWKELRLFNLKIVIALFDHVTKDMFDKKHKHRFLDTLAYEHGLVMWCI